jgi:hypothetical protein
MRAAMTSLGSIEMHEEDRRAGFPGPGGVPFKMKMLALEQAASPQGQLTFGF